MAKISVVVPVYGVEKYLEKCVDSLINQTMQDIEIILVDDGSPDNCPKMCDDYAKKDSRIKVVHKENGGLSDARNVGVKYTTTDYVTFIDSDDYAELDMCEVLWNHMQDTNADIVTAFVNEVKNGEIVGDRSFFDPIICDSKSALEKLFKSQGVTMYAYSKLYKKSLLESIQYPKGKIYEDAFTTPYLLYEANTICVTSYRLVNYVRRGDSITLSKYKKKDLDCIEAHKRNLEFVSKEYPSLIEAAKFRYYWALMYIYDKVLINNAISNEEAIEIWTEIKKNKMKILKNNYVSVKRKIALITMLISRKVYLKVLKMTGE